MYRYTYYQGLGRCQGTDFFFGSRHDVLQFFLLKCVLPLWHVRYRLSLHQRQHKPRKRVHRYVRVRGTGMWEWERRWDTWQRARVMIDLSTVPSSVVLFLSRSLLCHTPRFFTVLLYNLIYRCTYLGERKRESQILAKLADRAIFFGDGLRYWLNPGVVWPNKAKIIYIYYVRTLPPLSHQPSHRNTFDPGLNWPISGNPLAMRSRVILDIYGDTIKEDGEGVI